MRRKIPSRLLVAGLLLGAGCASQAPQIALVRDPSNPCCLRPEKATERARELAPFAALSAIVYKASFDLLSPDATENWPSGEDETDPVVKLCLENEGVDFYKIFRRAHRCKDRMPVPVEVDERGFISEEVECPQKPPGPEGVWTQWSPSRLSSTTDAKAGMLGLYVEIWETSIPPTIAIAFKGTRPSSKADLIANSRWITRLPFIRWVMRLPFIRSADQYDIVKYIQEDLERELRATPRQSSLRIVATGHSLGGGLAQYLAYSMNSDVVPPVSQVYAFDPSPVTGWTSVTSEVRKRNAKRLKIYRIYERGEFLSAVRWVVRKLRFSRSNRVEIWEVRYNLSSKWNPGTEHGIIRFACKMGSLAGIVRENPQTKK